MNASTNALAQRPAVVGAQSLRLRLTRIAYAARDTNLYDFAAPDGAVLPACDAGSHITLQLPNGLERQYSVLHAAAAPTCYTIGIKRDPASRGGSRFMHDELRVGTVLDVLPPRNNFPLREDAAHTVLIAGGIGITPIFCMFDRLRALGRAVTLHYSCRSREDAALGDVLSALPNTAFHFDDLAGGTFLPIADIVRAAPPDAHLYCCGPVPMLAAFEASASHLPPAQVHVEYFTAKHVAATVGGLVVELARSGLAIEIPPGVSILHALQAAGVQIASSCEQGVCGACEVAVLDGIPDHRDTLLSPAERASNTTMLVCCSGAKTSVLTLDL